jgi:hypothetical protein
MAYRDELDEPRTSRGWAAGHAGMGALRITLLFGSAAVALALILTPIIEKQTDRMSYASYSASPYPAGVDMMTTGSVGQRGNGSGSYVLRRSVLQPSPNSVCVIRANGMRNGDC